MPPTSAGVARGHGRSSSLVVSILTEYGENGRFRLLVDPLVIGVTVGMVVTAVARLVAARRSGHHGEIPA